jgi:hypothetical protein
MHRYGVLVPGHLQSVHSPCLKIHVKGIQKSFEFLKITIPGCSQKFVSVMRGWPLHSTTVKQMAEAVGTIQFEPQMNIFPFSNKHSPPSFLVLSLLSCHIVSSGIDMNRFSMT